MLSYQPSNRRASPPAFVIRARKREPLMWSTPDDGAGDEPPHAIKSNDGSKAMLIERRTDGVFTLAILHVPPAPVHLRRAAMRAAAPSHPASIARPGASRSMITGA